jgi:hypothetical protein
MGLDVEFTKWLATLGIGGILAGFMFTFYRKDVKQYTELWKSTADILIGVVKDNTATNTKLITMIENQERNALRKSDIEFLIDEKVRQGKQ